MSLLKRDYIKFDSLFEETSSSLLSKTWTRIKVRVNRQTIVARYDGMDYDGTMHFSANSGTTPSRRWHTQVQFEKLSHVADLYKLDIEDRKKRILKMLLKGDIKVY